MMPKKFFVCPICGYDKLEEAPYDETGEPSFEICPCCGIEFGFDLEALKMTADEYRAAWIGNGGQWFDSDEKPQDWDLCTQLKNIGEDNT